MNFCDEPWKVVVQVIQWFNCLNFFITNSFVDVIILSLKKTVQ